MRISAIGYTGYTGYTYFFRLIEKCKCVYLDTFYFPYKRLGIFACYQCNRVTFSLSFYLLNACTENPISHEIRVRNVVIRKIHIVNVHLFESVAVDFGTLCCRYVNAIHPR